MNSAAAAAKVVTKDKPKVFKVTKSGNYYVMGGA